MPKSNPLESNKVSIIGCGRVGMSAAFSLLHRGITNELVLLGRDKKPLVGEQLDLEHGMAFLQPGSVLATDNYEDIADSDVVVITAGVSQRPGDTRLDLCAKNSEIIGSIIAQVVKHAPEAVILMVSNPVDVLTYKAYQQAKLPKGQIFGSGTLLDTSRFRFHLSEFLKVNPRSIHAYILGEHGDSSFPVLSSASVGSQPLSEFPNFSEKQALEAYQKARDAAYRIIATKGATYYGIGAVVSHLVKTILTDARTVLPVSVPLHNYHGYSGVALSAPCVIGRRGVETILKPKLNWQEKQWLDRSVNVLKQYSA